MHYTELAKELKSQKPEYANRDDKELVESYLQKNSQDRGIIDFNEKRNLGQNIYGTAQAISQGALAGQAPHLAGLGQAIGGSAYNLINKQNPLKDFVKDYKEGREDFKAENKSFAQDNPSVSLGAEILGGAVGIGKLGKIANSLGKAKSLFLANNPVLKAGLVGAGYGSAYGGSNTLGKGFDIKSAITDGAIGGVTGGLLSKFIPTLTQKLLNGRKTEQLGEGAKKVLLENGKVQKETLPTEIIDVEPIKENPSQVKELLLPQQKTNKLAQYIDKAKDNLKTGYQADGIDFIVPDGMENKNFRAFLNNPKIQYEASKGSLGRRWETLQKEAENEFHKMHNEINKVVETAYDIVPKDTMIPMQEGADNVLTKMAQEVAELGKKEITIDQTQAIKQAVNLLEKIQKVSNKGTEMSFGNIQDTTKQLYALAQKYDKKDNQHASEMFKKMYGYMKAYRDSNPEVAKASELYKDFKSINKTLHEIGFDVETKSQADNIGTRVQTNGRGRAGDKLNVALDKVARILEKYPELKQFQELKDKVQLAQVSYDARPTSNSKLLNSVMQTITQPIKSIGNIGNREAQDDLQALGFRILTKQVNPQEFNSIDLFKGGDLPNRIFYKNKAYGNIGSVLKSKNINKDTIEKAYEEFLKNGGK